MRSSRAWPLSYFAVGVVLTYLCHPPGWTVVVIVNLAVTLHALVALQEANR